MGKRPGQEEVDHGPIGTAISSTTRGNATAFGFSITITGSFGMLQALVGSPSVLEIVMFGVAAAATIGTVEGVVTGGFRARPGAAPPEVRMLGTAQNFYSVAAGLGARRARRAARRRSRLAARGLRGDHCVPPRRERGDAAGRAGAGSCCATGGWRWAAPPSRGLRVAARPHERCASASRRLPESPRRAGGVARWCR
jgi:hypothetical protein